LEIVEKRGENRKAQANLLSSKYKKKYCEFLETSFLQENRVLTLRKEVDHCTTMAQLIEYNLEDVDAAIMAVRVALANGMNWDDLKRMIKEERKLGNPVAGLIDRLHLERNCITLLLSNNLDEMDEEEKTTPVEKVLLLSTDPIDQVYQAFLPARKSPFCRRILPSA
jgi:hypothetical protein